MENQQLHARVAHRPLRSNKKHQNFVEMLERRLLMAVHVLTFEGLGDLEPVNEFYNGGSGGNGSGPGPTFGISFSGNSLAIIDADAGGTGNFGGEPSPDTTMFWLSGAAATMNVPAGFDKGFSFFYSTPFYAGTIVVYDGLNASGNVLATLNLPRTADTGAPDPSGTYSPLVPFGVTFTGIAKSVDFSGTANYIGFDDITLGSSTPGIPNAPTDVQASDGQFTDHVAVKWDVVTAAEYYELWRRPADGLAPATKLAAGITLPSYDDQTAQRGISYYYIVKAGNNAGTGEGSDEDKGYLGIAEPGFQIELSFASGFTDKQRAQIRAAADRWQQVIVGELPDGESNGRVIDDLLIDLEFASLQTDFPGALAVGGPRQIRPNASGGLPLRGGIRFSNDLSALNKLLYSTYDIALHEMGHVLGFSQDVLGAHALVTGTQFTGAAAVREFNDSLKLKKQVVAVPLDPAGSAHWSERVFGSELMTPISETRLKHGLLFWKENVELSRITVAAMEDLGYTVNLKAADKYKPAGKPPLNLLSFASADIAERLLVVEQTPEDAAILWELK